MKHTDNPYIDIIVNCVKILGMNAVVKNENEALHYEDVRSAKMAADYMKWKEGYWDYKKGTYTEETYMEWNSYYRMLYGLPPAYTLDDEYAYLTAMGLSEDDPDVYQDIGNAFVIPALYNQYFIDMSQYQDSLPPEMTTQISLTGKYLHELTEEELGMIESCGIMKQIMQEYQDPHYQYIYHLGDKRVDFYTARKADNFSLLWIPELNTFDIIEQKFKRLFDRNRAYTIATVYSEAYRFMSYHYDAFIEILIIIQTMVDMISEVQEYIINKDVFDSRTIRYLFESYGIAYYKEIPVKYQIRIIKNVNTLLKYKSSHRNIVDILELFDNDDINIYTYYLMKTKKIHRDDFFYYSAEDVNPKYGTNRDYWLGNPKDISNNKVPLTNVQYNLDEPEFIKKYIYSYTLPKYKPDIRLYRVLSERQVIIDTISKGLDDVTTLKPATCFLDNYMRNDIVKWFGINSYNQDNPSQQIYYLKNRDEFLITFGKAVAEGLKEYMDSLCNTIPSFALNRYYCKRIKYYIYAYLGIFNEEAFEDEHFDDMPESVLNQYFYNVDDLLTDSYRERHDIPEGEYGVDSEDRFILHHTIPFMTFFPYRGHQYNNDCEIFQNTSTFSILSSIYPDLYDKWTKLFRRTYINAVKGFVEGLFDNLTPNEYDATPNYIGWMDVNYAIGQLGKPISEFNIGDELTTKGHDLIPIYNNSYMSDVVTEDMVGQEYYKKNYDLAFLKVPILSPNAYEMLERYDMRRSYDAITLADPFWDGVSNFDILTDAERSKLHESKKNEILERDFTIERTKYIGVEAAINLTKMSYQICYFMNMLFDKHKDEENLYIDIDSSIVSNGRVRLNDILAFSTALNYLYQGIEPDVISTDMEKNMFINGFNFDTDWTDIYNCLQNHHAIYNNYNNTPDAEYSYIDEYGVRHDVANGYGMQPIGQGWKSELYEDFVVYEIGFTEYKGIPSDELDPETGRPVNERSLDDARVGAFLSGRYEQCPTDCATSLKFNLDFGHSDIWNYNLKNHVVYDWNTGNLTTIDISWSPTQYPNDDNNSHGLWLNTSILQTMNDPDISDLEKINELKKIYYSNTNLYEHLTYMMRTAQSKRMYDIYKIVYESFMETKLSNDFYRLMDSNGGTIYTDKISGDLYRISEIEFYIKDDEGFPLYDLVNLSTGETERYHFVHNENFSDCKYVSDTDEVQCAKIDYAYIIENSISDFPRGYMIPENAYEEENKMFILAVNKYTMLQNIADERIIIPVTLNSDGTIASYIEGTTEGFITVHYEESTGAVTVVLVYPDETINKTIKPEVKVANDYYEYMSYRNQELYNILLDIKYNYSNTWDPVTESYRPSDEKRQKIEAISELIVVALEKYFDKKEWSYLFNTIPTANIKNIQNYIMKMVVFFKSWKTQVVDTSLTYLIDDPFNNYVQVLDDMYYNTTFGDLVEKVRPKEFYEPLMYTSYNDPIYIRDDVEMKIVKFEPYWVTFGFGEKIYGHKFDYPEFNAYTSYNDSVKIREKVSIEETVYTGDVTEDANGNLLFP